MYFVYILYSKRVQKYYVGSTKSIEERLRRHNSGRSTYTKKGMPWGLIYSESFETRKEAYKREMEIKKYKSGVKFKELINKRRVGRVA